MVVNVINSQPIPVAMVRHVGPYDQIGPAFEKLWGWISANNVPVKRSIGIYWDNPDEVPASQLRAAACVEVPAGFSVSSIATVLIEASEIAGGEYATTRFVGPYENLAPVWAEFTNYILETLNRGISQNPSFEVYVNDPSDTPASQLITELYMPLE